MTALIHNLITVASQVFILFLLIAIGFVAGKAKLFTDGAIKCISNFCLMFVTPAVIVKSFIREFSAEMGKNLLLALLASVICHIIGIIIGRLAFHSGEKTQTAMLKNAVLLSNAGFMAIPLQIALLGDIGSFYGSAYLIIFNIVLWTYSYSVMSAGSEKISIKKILLNPGIIAVVVGVPLFLFPISLPTAVTTTIDHIANLNTPLPMIVVGYYLSQASLKEVFASKRGLAAVMLRLIAVPLCCVFILRLLGFGGSMYVATIIAASAPIAVGVTMFSARFDGDTRLSANIVSVSTLFSIITMPIIVALAQTLAA